MGQKINDDDGRKLMVRNAAGDFTAKDFGGIVIRAGTDVFFKVLLNFYGIDTFSRMGSYIQYPDFIFRMKRGRGLCPLRRRQEFSHLQDDDLYRR